MKRTIAFLLVVCVCILLLVFSADYVIKAYWARQERCPRDDEQGYRTGNARLAGSGKILADEYCHVIYGDETPQHCWWVAP